MVDVDEKFLFFISWRNIRICAYILNISHLELDQRWNSRTQKVRQKFDRMLRVVMIKKRKVLFRKTFQINNQAIHFNSIRIRNGIAISKFNLKIWKIEII